jgi:hypothetical protein
MDGEEGKGMRVVMNEFDLLENEWCRVGGKCKATLTQPWWVDSAAMSTAVRHMAAAKLGFWLTILSLAPHATRIRWKQRQLPCWY